jgi:hypothetical protein
MMIIRLLLLTFALTIISCASNNIGIITPPYPDDIEIVGEALIDPDNFEDENGWAQSLVKIGDDHFLWLEKLDKRVETKAYFKVIFELKLPKAGKGYGYALASCGQSDRDVSRADITALIVHDEAKEWNDKIIRAWRADIEMRRIIEIPVDDIRCFNEGWGL